MKPENAPKRPTETQRHIHNSDTTQRKKRREITARVLLYRLAFAVYNHDEFIKYLLA